MTGHNGKRAEIEFRSGMELDNWLANNHQQSGSIWGIFWKKKHPEAHIDRETVLACLIRYGWIDSVPNKLDDDRSKLLLSPRKPGSAWSAVNKTIAQRLSSEGAMHPAGQAAVDAAVADGSWTMLDEVEAGIVPDDLRMALDAVPHATAHFDAFPKSARRGILEWIKQAKRPETRRKRIEETARLAGDNKRALDWRAKVHKPHSIK